MIPIMSKSLSKKKITIPTKRCWKRPLGSIYRVFLYLVFIYLWWYSWFYHIFFYLYFLKISYYTWIFWVWYCQICHTLFMVYFLVKQRCDITKVRPTILLDNILEKYTSQCLLNLKMDESIDKISSRQKDDHHKA